MAMLFLCAAHSLASMVAGVAFPSLRLFSTDLAAGAINSDMLKPEEFEASRPAGCRQLERVLVLEDEGLLSLMLEDLLQEAGAREVVICRNTAEALRLVEASPIGCAILDVSLHGRPTYDVADVLAERDIPFLFCTGLNRADLEARHSHRPLLLKPYGDAEFRAALALTLRR